MLSAEQLERVVVVLVGARNPQNIGAAARAMSNFGFTRLRVVNEYSVPFADARSAVNAGHVLNAAESFGSVAEAVADCALVVGTTAVGERRLELDVVPLDAVAGKIAAAAGGGVALLFGSEKTGLTNETIAHCNWLMTVPMHAAGTSMNLGQAVAVCLWELVRGASVVVETAPEVANAAEMERLTGLLREALAESGYNPANMDEDKLRRLVRRLDVSQRDAEMLMGMLRQILWKLRQS